MRYWHFHSIVCLSIVLLTGLFAHAAKPEAMVRLPGHVLPALAKAIPVDSKFAALAEQPLTLTLVLKRDDQPGFDQYLREVYDPKSSNYRKFLTQSVLADRFGPSRQAYDKVLRYLQDMGFTLVDGSTNRLTLTVQGTRARAEQAFAVQIENYQLKDKRFYANDNDPALPDEVAECVQSVVGLTELPQPYASDDIANPFTGIRCNWEAQAACSEAQSARNLTQPPATPEELKTICDDAKKKKRKECLTAAKNNKQYNGKIDPQGFLVDGTGQTVGLLEFDSFLLSDVRDYLDFFGLPISRLNNVSEVKVNGGAPLGADQDEVLLDIGAVLSIAPGAKVVVYNAPFTGTSTSFQALFNAMINGGVTIISNSWAYCEDQTTLADVQSLDSILQSAAAAGISVFNGSGDSGSTCLDGAVNTVAVPANSPNATAVGGTTATPGPGFIYGTEKWWDGTNDTPPTGQGGFGMSKFFSRPNYQAPFTASASRSVPDVVVNADPAEGVQLCRASGGGCPTGFLYGGTSVSAPIWAAFTALLNEAQGQNLGFLNPLIYPLANTIAFHNAASMGSDFAHVGLGSPNVNKLYLALSGQSAGAPSPTISEVDLSFAPPASLANPGLFADGQTQGIVVVTLRDAEYNVVSGKTVTLTASAGGQAVITPSSAVTTVDNGSVVFMVTDLTPETITFTVTDTTDGIVLEQTPSLTFRVPPAASASLTASPTPVTANGIATTTITVTLRDTLNRPTPGKEIRLSQGTGHSVITGPNPSVTDSSGQIQFTATNLFNETITYTAVDVTDDDLLVPGSAVVTFSNSSNLCPSPAPVPTGANGYLVTPFATGFIARPLNFGGIAYNGCPGVSTPAFRDDSVFFTDWTGDAIQLPATGGAVTNANRLANVGQTLAWPVVSKGGKLYAARASTGFGISGVIVEIDPTTGAVTRTLASGLSCPFSLAIDPLSGDLFFDGGCSGSFTDPRVRRIRNPDSASLTLEDYVTLSASPNGKISFAPDGTMYVVTGYFNTAPTISRVSGTNVPGTPTVTTVPGVNSFFWVNIGEVNANGSAKSLLTLSSQGLELVDITTNPPIKTLLANSLGGGEIGPDGCLYSPIETVVYRLTDSTGSCRFASATPRPSLTLTPTIVSPNPTQGSAQTFTATFRHLNVPVDTPVFFEVTGANPRVQLVRTTPNGEAVLTYTALSAGQDRIEATATINNEIMTSNKAIVTWAAGKHVTFLTLNPSPTSGTPGQVVTVIASLSDSSVSPPAPISGVNVTFSLSGSQCIGTTNSNGIASCALLVPNVTGRTTLTATFAGDGQFVTASDFVGFNVLAAMSSCVPSTEVCDGQDNDCDGQVDEGLGSLSCGTGACARTVSVCLGGIPQTCTPGAPTVEVCDGTDNNCNGTVDEGNPDGGTSCSTSGSGVCSVGTLTCTNGALVCQQTTQSSPEVCDGRDNNCNSQIDEGLGTRSCGVGACARTVNACVNGSSQTCTPGAPVAEVCGDGIDQDCNGADLVCPPPPTAQCPRGLGYWKNHPEAWSVISLELGTQTSSKTELVTLLGKPSQGDASVILAHQLIAAKLNVATGVDEKPISATIMDSDQRLSAFSGKLPYKVKPSTTAGKALVKAADKLEGFNDGELTPQCHDDEGDEDDDRKTKEREKDGKRD